MGHADLPKAGSQPFRVSRQLAGSGGQNDNSTSKPTPG
jgi:hypothetical protein